MHQAPGGLNASMRPSHDPAIGKAGLAFRSEPLTYDRRDLDQQRKLLADRFAGVGWHAAELISAAAQADDFYFDAFAQVRMETWSRGRVTLCGDAGYCASPLSGMGTSLALVGAYVLAGRAGPGGRRVEHRARHHRAARYAEVMRPDVESARTCQRASTDTPRCRSPTSRSRPW